MNHKNSIIWKRTALLVGVLALTAAGELMAQTGATSWFPAEPDRARPRCSMLSSNSYPMTSG